APRRRRPAGTGGRRAARHGASFDRDAARSPAVRHLGSSPPAGRDGNRTVALAAPRARRAGGAPSRARGGGAGLVRALAPAGEGAGRRGAGRQGAPGQPAARRRAADQPPRAGQPWRGSAQVAPRLRPGMIRRGANRPGRGGSRIPTLVAAVIAGVVLVGLAGLAVTAQRGLPLRDYYDLPANFRDAARMDRYADVRVAG